MDKLIYYFIALFFITFGSCVNKDHNANDVYLFENKYSTDVHTPVVEMDLNGKPKYWIIDTGANMSIIDSKYYHENESDFTYLTNIDMTLNGVSGSKDYEALYVSAIIGDSITINHQFLTSDLTGVINNMKERLNVDIIGILGADYLDRYSYTVDFYNKSMYINKLPLDSLLKK